MVETTRHPRIPLSSDRGRRVRVGIGARTSRLCASGEGAGGGCVRPPPCTARVRSHAALVHRRRAKAGHRAASRRRSEMRGGGGGGGGTPHPPGGPPPPSAET